VLTGTLNDQSVFDANGQNVSVGGLFLAAPATLDAPPGTFSDSGVWNNQGGKFNTNNGTVILNVTNQHLFGKTTFYNLTKNVAPGDTLTFPAGAAQTVTGLLNLQGVVGAPLNLRSSTPGTPWELETLGGVSLGGVNATDSLNFATPPSGAFVDTPAAVQPADTAVQANFALATTGLVYGGLVAQYAGPGDTNMYWGALVGSNGGFQAVIFRNVNGTWTQLNAVTPVTLTSSTNTLRFEVFGPSLKLFINNMLATFANDAVLTATGSVGLRSGNGVTIANFLALGLASGSNSLPFSNNFNLADGELGANWYD
jgi:hypothetical protein